MHRTWRAVGVALMIALPLGFAGAWAFNPDSGAVLHSEVLWHIFGGLFEVGLFLVAGLVVAGAAVVLVRKALHL